MGLSIWQAYLGYKHKNIKLIILHTSKCVTHPQSTKFVCLYTGFTSCKSVTISTVWVWFYWFWLIVAWQQETIINNICCMWHQLYPAEPCPLQTSHKHSDKTTNERNFLLGKNCSNTNRPLCVQWPHRTPSVRSWFSINLKKIYTCIYKYFGIIQLQWKRLLSICVCASYLGV